MILHVPRCVGYVCCAASLLVVLAAHSGRAQSSDASDVAFPALGATTPLPPLTPFSRTVVGGGPPLSLGAVLESVDAHHPSLVGAEERVRAARGSLLSAEGAFDLQLQGNGWVAPAGYYQYARADVSLVQPTPLWGLSVFGAWRIGRGFDQGGIPLYYGFLETLDAGEFRAGLTVPLWRDGPIDARRAGIARAEQGVVSVEAERDARRLRVLLAATEAYWRWVAAGLKLNVMQELLELAEARDAQLASRVRAGAIAAFEHLENRRAVLERRQQVIASRRVLERAALQLSLYWRRNDGEPRRPGIERVPGLPPRVVEVPEEEEVVARALERRPEVARVRALRSAAAVALELAANQVAPQVNFSAQGMIDVGGGAADSRAHQILAQPVLEAWVTFSMPLQLRDARGRAESAHGEVGAITAELELVRNQISMEARDALSALRAALESALVAEEMREVAELVAAGERTRFETGATTLLIVNLRESAAASARAVLIDARADGRIAAAAVDVATGRDPLLP